MKYRLIGALAVTLAALAPLAPAGCTNDTGGKRFSFEARAGGIDRADPNAPFVFTNETGWTITLTKADVTMGPLYLNVIAPLRDGTQSFLDLFEKTAWAAGSDHLGEGRVVGEVLAQLRFNALSSQLTAFPALGTLTQEEVRTAEIWFYPAPGISPDTTKIDTVALDVAGEATSGSSNVRFRGALILNDAWLEDAPAGSLQTTAITSLRKVRGISTAFFPSEGGHLEVRFDVARLFRGADFSNLTSNPTDPDGTKVLVQSKTGKFTTDQVMTNLFQGLRASSGTYTVRWATN